MPNLRRQRIGLALSGGGFRATAFGLGALRALHDRDLLKEIEVVSGISGGSLLTAMWAYGPESFQEFDDSVTELLRRGLQRELLLRAFSPKRATANLTSVTGAVLPAKYRKDRKSTRTEALVDALVTHDFGRKTMSEVTHPGLTTIISATDLSTGNAVRFGSDVSSSSTLGVIAQQVPVADAVAASAAFPLLLPQLNREYTFQLQDGTEQDKTVLMTDGGVYDNLGLSPLLPGRSKQYTRHVHDLNYIIAVDAGVGRAAKKSPNFMLGRLARAFGVVHTRSQDGYRARIHELSRARELHGVVYSYLGMRDARLPIEIPDLVSRSRVAEYPTNFAPMSLEDLEALTTRGEQLTRVLISSYCPELGVS
ncbi:patatin-like phospholipase family protein [Pseudarthrobacter sp. B4EP4b]|uniref:patatin-like phospholipase family protein n=1 Tax=Pseudarthrobacter sp. B4EP4b TaxID=2590664 RepID=UPI00114DE72F|nr:patatin-like phospholipase family protein [Pseudarthrobacter sp. B4EP4b]